MRLKDSAQITNSLHPSKDFGLGHKGLERDREKKQHNQTWLLDKGGALGKIKKCLAFPTNIKEKETASQHDAFYSKACPGLTNTKTFSAMTAILSVMMIPFNQSLSKTHVKYYHLQKPSSDLCLLPVTTCLNPILMVCSTGL